MIEQLHIFSVCTFYQLKVLSFIWSFFLDNTLFFLFNRKLLLYVLITFSVALTVWFFSLDAYSSYLLLHNKVPPNQAALKKKKEYQLLLTDKRIRSSASDTVSQGGGVKLFGQGYSHLKINCYKFCFHSLFSSKVSSPHHADFSTELREYGRLE